MKPPANFGALHTHKAQETPPHISPSPGSQDTKKIPLSHELCVQGSFIHWTEQHSHTLPFLLLLQLLLLYTLGCASNQLVLAVLICWYLAPG